jgi:hypothetical protein
MCKPIKNGVTNYALVFFKSAYLYRWRWHLGKGASPAAHGQPTDTDALDEEDEVQLGYIRGMMDELIGEFNNTGAIGFFDKAFTSIKLLAALAARGVRAVGMLRAKRPKAMPRGARWHWPFRVYSKEEVEDLEPGWQRAATTELPCGVHLRAEAWRDNRLVTLLSTTYHSTVGRTVQRWSRSLRAKVTRACSVPLKMYCEMMGGVDRFNKLNAQTNMRMGRCSRRYHRQLFFSWHLSGIGVCNVRTAFDALWPDAAELRKQKNGTTGYNWFVQREIGRVVREHGQTLRVKAAARAGSPQTDGDRPKKKPRANHEPNEPVDHGDLVHHSKVVAPGGWDENRHANTFMTRDRCRVCSHIASTTSKQGKSGRLKMPDGKDVPKPVWVCKTCKVNRCLACKERWDHRRNRPVQEQCGPCL